MLLLTRVFSDPTAWFDSSSGLLYFNGTGVITSENVSRVLEGGVDASSIKNVTIGPGIYGIASESFTSLVYDFVLDYNGTSSLQIIDEKAFYNSGVTGARIPDSLKEVGDEAFRYSNLSYFDVSSDSELLKIGSKAFCNTNLTAFTIPNTTVLFGAYAFCNNSRLSDVAYLGTYASNDTTLFDSTNLSYITVESSFPSKRFGGLPISKIWLDSSSLLATDYLIIAVVAGAILAFSAYIVFMKCRENKISIIESVENQDIRSPLVDDPQERVESV